MIEKVTKYETSDGKLHDSEQKAKDHDLDRAREILGNATMSMMEKYSASDHFQLVMKALPTYEDAILFNRKLSRILE